MTLLGKLMTVIIHTQKINTEWIIIKGFRYQVILILEGFVGFVGLADRGPGAPQKQVGRKKTRQTPQSTGMLRTGHAK